MGSIIFRAWLLLFLAGWPLLPGHAQTKAKSSSSSAATKSATPKPKKKTSNASGTKNSATVPAAKPKTGSTPPSAKKKTGSATAKPGPKSTPSTPAPQQKATGTDEDLAPLPQPTGAQTTPAPVTSSATPPSSASNAPSTPADLPDTTDPTAVQKALRAPNATIEPEELAEFSSQPEAVQRLIRNSLALTKRNLTYTYGSADPARGGMDCSGTIHYVLREQGLANVPRDASAQYVWARKNGQFFAVVGKNADSFEFDDLRPGDLLFWTGTYSVDRDPPITHSMIYLGTEKRNGKRVMFGASDGRSYDGKSRWGVSVFDFKMPRTEGAAGKGSRADFVGYARIPSLVKAE